MSKMKLWEISAELDAIADELIEAGGVISEELEAKLDAMTEAFEQKAENIALVYHDIMAHASAAKAEADRLSSLHKSHKNAADGLKAYLHEYLKRQEVDKLKTSRVNIRRQKNSRPSIEWTGPADKAPQGYQRVEYSVDTKLAYEQWKAGEELPPGFVVSRGEHIRIS
jgi:hypothetical protein